MERDVEIFLVKEVKRIGGLIYKFTSPGNAGVPDRIVIHEGVIRFVELKDRTGELSVLQKAVHRRLHRHGVRVYVIKTKEEVEKFILSISGGDHAVHTAQLPT